MMLVLRGNVLNLCSFGRVLHDVRSTYQHGIRDSMRSHWPSADFKISLSGYGTIKAPLLGSSSKKKGAGQMKTCLLSSNTENTKKPRKRRAFKRLKLVFRSFAKRFQNGISKRVRALGGGIAIPHPMAEILI